MQYFVLKSCSIAFGILAFIAPALVVMSGPRNQTCGNPVIGMLGIAGLSIVGSFIVAFAFEKEAYRLRHPLPPVPLAAGQSASLPCGILRQRRQG
jgi:hypothetical protein